LHDEKRYLLGPNLDARRRTLARYQDVVGDDVLRIREVESSDKFFCRTLVEFSKAPATMGQAINITKLL